MKDFHNLKIDKLMTRGLAFVWAPKEILSDLFKEMQAKGFVYVENLEIINLDIDLARTMCGMTSSKHAQNGTSTSLLNEGRQDEVRTIVNLLDKVDPSELIAAESSTYFNKSKRTLMMFRKVTICLNRSQSRSCSCDTNGPATWFLTCP